MEYKVDGWNNFCRVFELPKSYPKGFCFSGGHSVAIQMVDWFYPVPQVNQPAVSKEVWRQDVGVIEITVVSDAELREKLIPFLQEKLYVKPNREYLVLTDFGAAFTFKKEVI
jgi:hypothetical protein